MDFKDLDEDYHQKSIRIDSLKAASRQTQPSLHQFSYHPNFVLIDSHRGQSRQLFGDIVPMYGSYQELASIIVTSWESLYNLILHCNAFIVCVLSFFSQVVNSAMYQSYLLVTAGYQQVTALPNKFESLKQKYLNLLDILSQSETRDLWWLEVKIDIRTTLHKLQVIYTQIWTLAQKFYLVFIVCTCLGILNFGSVINSAGSSSFLSSFLTNNTFISASALTTQGISGASEAKIASASAINSIPVQKIVEHTVGEEEKLIQISEMYSVSIETLQINNDIQNEVVAGQKLYIPWKDGYIYNAQQDISVEQLSQIFGIDGTVISLENTSILNTETNKFAKDSLILLPTTDFASVQENLQKELERQESLKAAEEMRRQRQENLSQKAVTSNTYKDVYSSAPKTDFFNWPSNGSISRCVQPGHVACDLANFSAPPVFAMQDATVSKVSNFELACYGLAVILDHGVIDGVHYKTLYAHLSEIYVREGQKVDQNQSIGKMGSTGCSTGTHLHFEVIADGVRQNPLNYLP